MSIADAITAATGLENGRDFEVRDEGDGPFLANWYTKDLPLPDDAQLAQWQADFDAGAKVREKDRVLRSRAMEYLVSLMYQQELADAGKLTAIKSDIATEIAKVDVATVDPAIEVKP
jgi:hypothetical protein